MPGAKAASGAVFLIVYGLLCAALGVLVMLGVIRGVPFAGAFVWGAYGCAAFMIFCGVAAFWWADD